MPNLTPFLGLIKPLQSEQYDISVFHNPSMDSIDTFASGTDTRLDKLEGPARIRVRQNTAQAALANATWTPVQWDTEDYKVGFTHDNATNNSRITVPETGLYFCQFLVCFTANATGIRELQVRKGAAGNPASGTQIDSKTNLTAVSANTATLLWESEVQLTANDVLELFAYQNCGGGMSLVVASPFMTYGTLRRVV